MCLGIVLRGKEKKAALAKLKDTIVVWKVLIKPNEDNNHYTTDIKKFPIYAGETKFKQPVLGGRRFSYPTYRGGGHFWLTKVAAVDWGVYFDCKLVRCTIKKLDINAIGYQWGNLVVVAKRATFPKYIGKKG